MRRKKGFTIVETLVAIAILMIAIAGPLSIASKGLTSAVYARDQMVATFLAQESMEKIVNVKDNNIDYNLTAATPVPWTDGFLCDSTATCDADAAEGITLDSSSCSTSIDSYLPGCRLFFNPATSAYGRSSASANPTQFYRHYTIGDESGNTNAEERTVHVFVSWKEGTIPYQIDLSSQLLDVLR